ncbi:MAG: hypothetical protein JNM76_00840 [Betaproteobacteria bacterium]|nr:hypothetical protein [Betaproteobacteria bacterium]
MSLRIFATAICLATAALAPALASAQSGRPVMITVTPDVAEPGVQRTIRVSGSWPLACSRPIAIEVTALPFNAPGASLSIRTLELVFSPCPPTGQDISLTTTFTPQAAGVQSLTLIHAGEYVAQGKLVTRPAAASRAATDITGVWHDPAVPGHGFALYHSQTGSDILAGAWYAYDSAGKPHWLFMTNVRWNDATRFIADLSNLASAAQSCGLLLPGCAKPQLSAAQSGRLNGELLQDGKLRLVVTAGPPFADPPFPLTLVLERLTF